MSFWARVNLVLALIALLLALRLWWPGGTPAGERLTGLQHQHIDELRVERGDRLVLAAQRQGTDWQLRFPDERAADPQRIGQLLAIAAAPVWSWIDAPDSPAAYGLARPAAVLMLDRTRIAFGDRDATQHGRYVQVDGRIGVVDDLLFYLLGLPAGHFAAE